MIEMQSTNLCLFQFITWCELLKIFDTIAGRKLLVNALRAAIASWVKDNSVEIVCTWGDNSLISS